MKKFQGCIFALIGLWGGGGSVSIAPLWCRWHLTLLKRENKLDYMYNWKQKYEMPKLLNRP